MAAAGEGICWRVVSDYVAGREVASVGLGRCGGVRLGIRVGQVEGGVEVLECDVPTNLGGSEPAGVHGEAVFDLGEALPRALRRWMAASLAIMSSSSGT